MKKIIFSILLVCSFALAQGGDAQTESVWEEPVKDMPANTGYEADVTEKEGSPVVTTPSKPKKESWREAWMKRRDNISLFFGILPVTFLAEVFVHEEDRDPDVTAFSIAYGHEFFYLLEVGIMANYTTVAGDPLFTVTPRLKLNYLNFKYIRMYSYFGLGAIFWDGGSFMMFNAAALGFELGGPISVFGEFGWGQVGMFVTGIKYAF